MSYQFPPDVAQLVNDQMVRGGYQSADDVLRDALRALDEISLFRPAPSGGKITSLEELRREVCRGIEQLDRGDGIDADALFGAL